MFLTIHSNPILLLILFEGRKFGKTFKKKNIKKWVQRTLKTGHADATVLTVMPTLRFQAVSDAKQMAETKKYQLLAMDWM